MKAVLDREGVYMGKTYDEWIRLDKAYPDGVRYTQAGFPDFSIYAYKDKMGNPIQVKLKEWGGGVMILIRLIKYLKKEELN